MGGLLAKQIGITPPRDAANSQHIAGREDVMKITEIRGIAQELGVTPGRMNKKNLILAIQNKEGNSQCFDSEVSQCDQLECCWRSDCLKD